MAFLYFTANCILKGESHMLTPSSLSLCMSAMVTVWEILKWHLLIWCESSFSSKVCGPSPEDRETRQTWAFQRGHSVLQWYCGFYHHLSSQWAHRGGRLTQRPLHMLWCYHWTAWCLQGECWGESIHCICFWICLSKCRRTLGLDYSVIVAHQSDPNIYQATSHSFQICVLCSMKHVEGGMPHNISSYLPRWKLLVMPTWSPQESPTGMATVTQQRWPTCHWTSSTALGPSRWGTCLS